MSESAKQHRADLKSGKKIPMENVKAKYISIRIPEQIKEKICEVADLNTRTLAAQVLHYIKRGLEQDQKGQK